MSDLVSVQPTRLNHRKSLFLAVLLTAGSAALIFIFSKAFVVDRDFIGSLYENGVPRALAGFFFIAFPYMHQRMAGKRRINFSHLPDGAVPFEDYGLPWYILLAYGVLITFAVAGMSIFLVWLVGVATGFFITRAVPILNLVLLFPAFYYLGFWTGSRSAHNPYLNAVGIVLGYTILEVLVTVVLNIDTPLRSPFGLVVFLILSLIAAFIGALLGRRRRLLSYVGFLLALTTQQDRQMVVNNIYGDVRQRISDE